MSAMPIAAVDTSIANWRVPVTTIAERSLAQTAHAWDAQTVPFSDQPKADLFRTASIDRVTPLLGLNLPEQPAFALILVGDQYLLSALRPSLPSGPLLPHRRSRPHRELSPSELEP